MKVDPPSHILVQVHLPHDPSAPPSSPLGDAREVPVTGTGELRFLRKKIGWIDGLFHKILCSDTQAELITYLQQKLKLKITFFK